MQSPGFGDFHAPEYAMAGRPPTPTAIRVLNGSAAHDPQRTNHEEPKPRIGASPPPFLPRSGPARSAWKRHAAVLERLRVLTEADADALAVGCIALAEAVAAQSSDDGWRRADMAWRRYFTVLTAFGLTPSSRVRIHAIAPEAPADPMEQWMARKATGG
jgi:phage terminase small subunit